MPNGVKMHTLSSTLLFVCVLSSLRSAVERVSVDLVRTFVSKSLVNRSSKAQFRAELLRFEHILSEYCDAGRLLRRSMGISFASTCKLVAGDVRNAPKQRRSA